MWMKSFTHMSCQSIGLLAAIFSSSKTVPPYPQYGKELFASLPHTGPSPTDLPWDIRDRWVHDLYPFLSATLLVEQWQRIPWGGGYKCISRLLKSMCKRLKECINKGGSHTRYYLQFINL